MIEIDATNPETEVEGRPGESKTGAVSPEAAELCSAAVVVTVVGGTPNREAARPLVPPPKGKPTGPAFNFAANSSCKMRKDKV